MSWEQILLKQQLKIICEQSEYHQDVTQWVPKLKHSHRYLYFHSAFKTSTPEKLYSSLQRYAGDRLDIAAIMDTWTRQAGYPLITVQVHADRQNVSISQRRFLLKNKDHNDQTKWDIPLNTATSWDNANFERTSNQFIFSKRLNKSLEIELINKTDWIIFNVQQTGKHLSVSIELHYFYFFLSVFY